RERPCRGEPRVHRRPDGTRHQRRFARCDADGLRVRTTALRKSSALEDAAVRARVTRDRNHLVRAGAATPRLFVLDATPTLVLDAATIRGGDVAATTPD